MVERPFVSLILPTRNERRFVRMCLDSILANDYPRDSLELLLIDGQSEDGTRDILEEYAARELRLILLDNPRRTGPAAMNLGIEHVRGDLIIRLDAHTWYPPDYVSSLVTWSLRSGADNVGGVLRTCPGDHTATAEAIAIALSHRFGIGNALFRVGAPRPTWVDTVPFGCYRREVFERIGTFEESVVRDDDDDFNRRLFNSGGDILLVPDIRPCYFARESLGKIAHTYYQYGYFKPLVIRRVGGVFSARQLVPATFVTVLALLGTLAILVRSAALILAAILIVYGAATIANAISATRARRMRSAALLCVVFPLVHISNGVGFLRGVWHFLIQRNDRKIDPAMVPLTR